MQLSNDVIEVLARSTISGPALYLPGTLDRALYTKTNKALVALGGAWDRKRKGHIFASPAGDKIADAIESGSVANHPDEDKLLGFFRTPQSLAAMVVSEADLFEGALVLEPSGGDGAIAQEAAATGAVVDAVEIHEGRCATLRGIGGLRNVTQADFLTLEPRPIYDRVVANPPFARGADAQHILHMLKFLRPGGRLVSIAGAGVLFRDTGVYRQLREVVARCGDMHALPERSFSASGTNVNTALVRCRVAL